MIRGSENHIVASVESHQNKRQTKRVVENSSIGHEKYAKNFENLTFFSCFYNIVIKQRF